MLIISIFNLRWCWTWCNCWLFPGANYKNLVSFCRAYLKDQFISISSLCNCILKRYHAFMNNIFWPPTSCLKNKFCKFISNHDSIYVCNATKVYIKLWQMLSLQCVRWILRIYTSFFLSDLPQVHYVEPLLVMGCLTLNKEDFFIFHW